jgi:hypothetical protein
MGRLGGLVASDVEVSKRFSPEERLLLAMISRAVKDVRSPNPGEVRDAIAWIQGKNSCSIITFDSACEYLGSDAEALRREILKGIDEGLGPLLELV